MINGKLIKKRIIDKNYSQKELAEKIGITEITLSRWINGKIGNNIEKFVELCKILEIEYKDIKK